MTTIPNAPPGVGDLVDGLAQTAQQTFGADLVSVVLYGSAAEGRMRATSDVNVLFVLSRFDKEKADAFREPFRVAQAAANVTAMFLLEDEISAASSEFAQKFADMQKRHIVLAGRDPFLSLAIPREDLVRRLQQVLLNLTIRLREMYLSRSLRDEQCAITVAESAGPLRTSAAAILELEGRGTLSPKEALETIVRDLNRPELAALLTHISEAREQRALPAGSASATLYDTLSLARVLERRARAL
jgi:hypothetical protein